MSKVQVETRVFSPRFSETVLHELDPRYSRKTVSLAATEEALPFGLVLMRDEAGQYAPFTETTAKPAQEGQPTSGPASTATPCAVLLTEVAASGEAQDALVLTGYCIVNASRLVFDSSVTLKAKALAALEDRGFVIEEVGNAPA